MELGYLQIMPKVTKFYLDYFKLMNTYTSIYSRTFQQAVKERDSFHGRDLKNTVLYEKWLEITDKELEIELRSEYFTSLLSNLVNSGIELRSALRQSGQPVLYYDWLFDSYMRNILLFSSTSKEYGTTPFDIVFVKGKMRLLHYHLPLANGSDSHHGESDYNNINTTSKIPLLIVYAPINRYHIMDLSYNRSIVRSLLSSGLDVYLLDWGFTDWTDSHLSLSDYVNYIEDAVYAIKNATGYEKISFLGYCWGGIISLIYVALNNDKVKSLALMAAPIDFSKDNTILATWSRAIDMDKVIDEFGHMDGVVLDLAFLMRNPSRYTFDKYLKFFEKLNDKQFVDNFIAVERWLHDTPIIPGNLYRQLINDCYKKNLLISGKMIVDNKKIDLQTITIPLLTIVAEQDDLASPESTLAVKEHVSSTDKQSIVMPGGHVGLCVSSKAHSKLWPEVAGWIKSRS